VIFTKLFSSGSVEQEALQIIIHQKKLAEQEKDLQQLLNKSVKRRYIASKSERLHSLKLFC
jgi:hypothetical protein